MGEALDLAAKGKGWTSPNPCVGALVVEAGRVLGRGYHHRAGGAHAEVIALQRAGPQARGATLYVTLEPCSHFGRTPPCVDRVLDSGVSRVVVAMADPNPQVRSRGLRKLRRAGIQVVAGVCRESAQRLNEDFAKFITTGRPFVTLKLALSLDGKIATRTGDSKWITGPFARARAHQLRHEHDAIMVGHGTVAEDDPRLTTRLPGNRRGKHPARVVVDTRAETPVAAQALASADALRFLVCGSAAPASRVSRLQRAGVQVLPVATSANGLDLNEALTQLAQHGLTSVLIEGGSRLAASALEAGIVDKVALFYAPKIIGGTESLSAIGGEGVTQVAEALQLRDATVERLGDDFLVVGYLR
jgi:diaminohydroxyphosphoribosylaminopyrimidine deaminase/5-amino-6-(5-phosphoribosylamino)uracil reductase